MAKLFSSRQKGTVEHLPLASDTEKRMPTQLSPEEHDIYDARLSFVGSSMTGNAISLRKIFLSQYKAYQDGSADAVELAFPGSCFLTSSIPLKIDTDGYITSFQPAVGSVSGLEHVLVLTNIQAGMFGQI